jgi:hypothetical protein
MTCTPTLTGRAIAFRPCQTGLTSTMPLRACLWPHGRGRASLLVPLKAIKADREHLRDLGCKRCSGVVDVRRGVPKGKLVEVFGNLKSGDKILERATDEIRPGIRISMK